PADYWRFTPQALELLLAKYPTRILGWNGPPRRPLQVWAAAFREAADRPTAEQFTRYRTLLGQYAREPLGPGRRLLYLLGRVLCGRRPFAPYLDRDRWQTELQHAPP